MTDAQVVERTINSWKKKLEAARKNNDLVGMQEANTHIKENQNYLSQIKQAEQQAKLSRRSDFKKANDRLRQAELNLQQAIRSGDEAAISQAKQNVANAESAVDVVQGLGESSKLGTDIQQATAGLGKGLTEPITNPNVNVDKNFYRGIMSGIFGNENDAKANKAKTMSENYKQSSAEHGAEAKQHQQIANRNEFEEAGKLASVQNDAENRQTINNTSYAAGNAAALQRKTNTPDVQAQREYQAQQRTQAEQQREKEQNDRQMIGMTKADEQQFRIASKDYNYATKETDSLSEGTDDQEDRPKEQPTKQEVKPSNKQNVQQPVSSNWKANAQQAINYMTYGNDPNGRDILKTLYDNQLISVNPDSVNPVNGKTNDAFQVYAQQNPNSNEATLYNELIGLANRVASDGSQINVGDNGLTTDQLYKQSEYSGSTTKTGANIKDVETEVSDMYLKSIIGALDDGEVLDDREVRWLMNKLKHIKEPGDTTDNSVLNDYADNIRNYLYTYREEAKRIDPSIDTEQEHIGPMAQDIEKVNPACIKETSDGTKTVDTGRLALMNAGAIADLARELKELKEVLND